MCDATKKTLYFQISISHINRNRNMAFSPALFVLAASLWHGRGRGGYPGEMDGGSGVVRLERSKVKGSWGSASYSDFLLSLSWLSFSDHVYTPTFFLFTSLFNSLTQINLL